MAESHFSSFLPSPFPQSTFVMERLGRLADRAAARLPLTSCQNESRERTYSACDGVSCRAKVTVYDTQTERQYCAKHFREVSRG